MTTSKSPASASAPNTSASPSEDDVRGLEVLRGIPPPRRSDDAFARSVADDVKRARAPRLLALPALAVGAAALAFVVARPDTTPEVLVDAGRAAVPVIAAGAGSGADVMGEEPVVLADVDPGLFSFPALEGSSQQELLGLEAALDAALDASRTARARQKL